MFVNPDRPLSEIFLDNAHDKLVRNIKFLMPSSVIFGQEFITNSDRLGNEMIPASIIFGHPDIPKNVDSVTV